MIFERIWKKLGEVVKICKKSWHICKKWDEVAWKIAWKIARKVAWNVALFEDEIFEEKNYKEKKVSKKKKFLKKKIYCKGKNKIK